MCECAIEFGHLSTLQWIISEGYPRSPNMCDLALKYSHIDILFWLGDNCCACKDKIDHCRKYDELYLIRQNYLWMLQHTSSNIAIGQVAYAT
jgi:hypothetical protein